MQATALSPAQIALSIDELGIDYGPLVARDATGRELASTMSLDGEQIVLEVDDTGAAYPVTIDPLIVIGNASLLTPTSRDSSYGTAISVLGTVAVIGEPDEPATTSPAVLARGAVHVFTRNGLSWSFTRTIRVGVPPAASSPAEFGASVDLASDGVNPRWLVVGSPGESSGRGAAYVIDLNGSFDSYGRQASAVRLVPGAGTIGERVGDAVAISGNRVVVGTNGLLTARAYTFTRAGTLESTLPTAGPGTGLFGSAVDIDPSNPNLVVIGAPSTNSGAGAVHVYRTTTSCAESHRGATRRSMC